MTSHRCNKTLPSTIRNFVACCVSILLPTLLLSGCGDSTQTPANINQQQSQVASTYAGPTAETDDIIAFQATFWKELRLEDRCGECHFSGGQPPAFVDELNVNEAYIQARSIVNFDNYDESSIVKKVAGVHFGCWEKDNIGLTDHAQCAENIKEYITAWKGGDANTDGKQIILEEPPIRDVGDSKNFPDTAISNDPSSFANTLHLLLTENCSTCHAETAPTPISPYFANDDVNSAYEAAKSKIDLDTPDKSRLVIRLKEELHNCWSNSCDNDAQEMLDAISNFSNAIELTQVDINLKISKAIKLSEATISSGGSRYENHTIALWEFDKGSGTTVKDKSGITPRLDLTLSGSFNWVLGNGIEIIDGKAQGSTTNSKKLYDHISASGQYAIEAWVIPANVSQEDAWVVDYSAGGGARNFSMGQDIYNYKFLNRTDQTGSNATPSFETADADEDLQASLQHVVVNYDPVNGRQIFVNGQFTGDVDTETTGVLSNWNESFALVLGNEPGGDALWKGKIRLAAIHSRALTQEQISQNHSVGVGLKYFMLFSVADLIGISDSYILFHVEQFDNNAYLFNEPRFINLTPEWVPTDNIIIKGLRIGINGRVANTGQAFGNMDEVINDSSGYDFSNNGQTLSTIGTIIQLEKGPESDEFFLSFEQIGDKTNAFIETDPTKAEPPFNAELSSDIGLRTFDEINATMSAITGIPVTEDTVSSTFSSYKQQLPSVENISAFLPSHQMAIAQLAMSYCNVLVNTNENYFTGFDFNQTAAIAFDDAGKQAIITPLLTSIMNVDILDPTNNLLTQPDETEIRDALGSTTSQDLDATLIGDSYDSLMTSMTQCAIVASPTCNTNARTKEIVKATCAATIGSAMMLIQ